MTTFSAVVDAVDHLSVDEQEELIDIVTRRLHEKRHQDLVEEAKLSRKEFDEGKAVEVTPETLFDDLDS